MGKLSVLGAQRVKALAEVLSDRKNEELNQLLNEQISLDEARVAVLSDLGLGDIYKEVVALQSRSKEIQEVLEHHGIRLRDDSKIFNTYDEAGRNFDKLSRKKVEESSPKSKEEIEKKYRHKEQMLWLCETLEEAKEIVGLD